MRTAPRAANPPAEAGRREQGGGGGCARRPPPPYCGAVSARRARRLVPGGAASSTGAAPQRRAGAAGVGSERPEPCGAGSASPPDPPAGRGSAAPGEARRDGGAEAALRRLRAPRRRREGAAGGPRSSPPAPLRYLCPVSGEGRGGLASRAGRGLRAAVARYCARPAAGAGGPRASLCAAAGRLRAGRPEGGAARAFGLQLCGIWLGFVVFFLNLSAGRSLSLWTPCQRDWSWGVRSCRASQQIISHSSPQAFKIIPYLVLVATFLHLNPLCLCECFGPGLRGVPAPYPASSHSLVAS